MADDKVITNQFHFPPLIFSIHLWNVITYCMSYSYITDTWLHIAYSYTDMWLHIARSTPSSRTRDNILFVLLNLHRNVNTYCTSYSFFTDTLLHIVRPTLSSLTRDYYCTFYSIFTETWLHIACHTPSSQNEQQSLLAGHDVTTQHVPLFRKLCYAIGGPPYQITNTVINFFLSIFLLEVAEVQ